MLNKAAPKRPGRWNKICFVSEPVELTILMPCLNEAETLARCIESARAFIQRKGAELQRGH